jgi:hypothetical protein
MTTGPDVTAAAIHSSRQMGRSSHLERQTQRITERWADTK